ncbi:hypothetical protein PO124_09770 [Bacillus licheniformis]|nr:hypothetical protein [Bacillus licheniformis]
MCKANRPILCLGGILIRTGEEQNEAEVYIPIKGRQGTYGVLKAFGPGAADTAADICIISNAAGKHLKFTALRTVAEYDFKFGAD